MTTPPDREAELRARLLQIDEEQRALAADDFAGRHELAAEADAVRAELQALNADAAAAAGQEWAERAGRKGSHEHDPEVAKGAIVSPIEGAGGTG